MRRFLTFLFVLPLAGHDLYLMPETFTMPGPGLLALVYQNGDGFPVGTSPVKPERLRNTTLHSKAGTAAFEKITPEAARTTAEVRVPGAGLAILTSSTLPNFIELEAKKFKSYLEHENLTHQLAWREKNGETEKPGKERYSKYVKSIVRVGKSDGRFREKMGLTIEFVPEADPYAVRPGGKLPVQLLFRGKPAADVAVEAAWMDGATAKVVIVGRTDANGRITVPIHATGPHRLHSIVMERCTDPKAADWESFWASLTFGVAAK